MRVTILGSGTSHGVPMIGCKCAVCLSDDTRNKRFRPSVVVENDGKTILVDTTPELRVQALAFGLPEAEALKGLTLYPAQIAGVAGRLGSIEPGKEATLFSADGDILDIRANVKHVWIAGTEISLETRHTRLYEKYKNRPKAE